MIVYTMILLCFISSVLSCTDKEYVEILDPWGFLGDIRIKRNESITIVCCFKDRGKSLSWIDSGGIQLKTDASNGIHVLESGNSKLILKIISFKKSMSDTYTCKSSLPGTFSSDLTLKEQTVFNGPQMHNLAETFGSNRNLTLYCGTQGDKLQGWTVSDGSKNKFYKLGKGLDPKLFKVSGNNLYLPRPIEINAPVWCHVKRIEHDDFSSYAYHIYKFDLKPVKVIIPYIEVIPSQPIKEFNKVEFRCKFPPCHKDCGTITIKPAGDIEDSKIKMGYVTTTFLKVTRKDHLKRITCTALTIKQGKVFKETTSKLLYILSEPIIKQIKPSKKEINLNENIKISCIINGHGLNMEESYFEKQINSSWYKITDSDRHSTDKKSVNNNAYDNIYELTLSIKRVTWNDRGKYRCKASNKMGEGKLETEIKVKRPIDLKVEPSSIYATHGAIKITCKLAGYPLPTDYEFKLMDSDDNNMVSKKIETITKYDEVWKIYELKPKKYRKNMVITRNCYFKAKNDDKTLLKPFNYNMVPTSHFFKIYKFCHGSTGMVFYLDKTKARQSKYRIVSAYITYRKIYENARDAKSASFNLKTFEKKGRAVIIIKDLEPSTVYKVSYKISDQNSLIIDTMKQFNTNEYSSFSGQNTVSFNANRKNNTIVANVQYFSDCLFKGVNDFIEKVVVRVKERKDDKMVTIKEYETNQFDVDYNKGTVRVSINVPTKGEYDITLKLKTPSGISSGISNKYRGESVADACYPKCYASSIFNIMVLIQSIIIAFIIVLLY